MKCIHGLSVPTSLADLLDSARLALVVYDMQVGICSQIVGGATVIAAVERVLEATRAAGIRTVFTRHMSLPLELIGVMPYSHGMAAHRRSDESEAVVPSGQSGFWDRA
jgi:nicotinamidase-related amidase